MKKGTKGSAREERVIQRCFPSGEVYDLTDELEKLAEEVRKKKENRGLRGLFKKIRNKVSKKPKDAQQD